MIRFKPEWAKGMDARPLEREIEEARASLLMTGAGEGAGRGIAYALAAACEEAGTELGAYNCLCFIMEELEKARLNMRAEVLVELEHEWQPRPAEKAAEEPDVFWSAGGLPLGLYSADIINGVSFAGAFVTGDEPWKMLDPETFRARLAALPAGEFIYARFTEEDRPLLEAIEREYGIHNLRD